MLTPYAGFRRSKLVFALLLGGWTSALQGAEISRPVMSRVPPDYPVVALRMRLEGKVVVEVTAMRDGSASRAVAVEGHPLLRHAAEQCVAQWRFLHMPKPERGTVTVVFSLSPEKEE